MSMLSAWIHSGIFPEVHWKQPATVSRVTDAVPLQPSHLDIDFRVILLMREQPLTYWG